MISYPIYIGIVLWIIYTCTIPYIHIDIHIDMPQG
jgi:hypothetical protein